ncbi:unnamed protein product [Arctogadus glacialis]
MALWKAHGTSSQSTSAESGLARRVSIHLDRSKQGADPNDFPCVRKQKQAPPFPHHRLISTPSLIGPSPLCDDATAAQSRNVSNPPGEAEHRSGNTCLRRRDARGPLQCVRPSSETQAAAAPHGASPASPRPTHRALSRH